MQGQEYEEAGEEKEHGREGAHLVHNGGKAGALKESGNHGRGQAE
jgi:hypothetical protein